MPHSSWKLSLGGDCTICVSPTVTQMTSYILLEQEDWFEGEIGFVRKVIEPGMHMLDIGANHGVYALSAARSIGNGHIWAFEPTSDPREKLAESIAVNGFSQTISLIPAGLSDTKRLAEMSTSTDSELNSLYGEGGVAERVMLLTLDGCVEEYFSGTSIDFIKLDAEGEEVAILRGGKRFFAEQSPLVMFELCHGFAINTALLDAFRKIGYDLYMLVPEAQVLVPYTEAAGTTLNLFACKPDRAQQLREREMLVFSEAEIDALPLDLEVTPEILSAQIRALPFARPWLELWSSSAIEALPPAYVLALSAAIEGGQAETSPLRRMRLWRWAWAALAMVGELRVETEMLRLHLLFQLGKTPEAVRLAIGMERQLGGKAWSVAWPVLPPMREAWSRASVLSPGEWASFRVSEFITLKSAYSAYYARSTMLSRLPTHLRDPDRSPRLDRMMALLAISQLLQGNPPAAVVSEQNRSVWHGLLDKYLGQTAR